MNQATRSQANQSTTALYDADKEVKAGDVVRYGGRPCFVERWDGKFVHVVTMDERRMFLRLLPRQLGLVVGEVQYG